RGLDLGASEMEAEPGRCSELLQAVAAHCPKLQELVVPFARASDAALAELAQRCPRLCVLYGVDCTGVTDEGVLALARAEGEGWYPLKRADADHLLGCGQLLAFRFAATHARQTSAASKAAHAASAAAAAGATRRARSGARAWGTACG
ncbi:MAG: hypothetical protein ACK4UX_13280, partial [Thiobacillus sp.]